MLNKSKVTITLAPAFSSYRMCIAIFLLFLDDPAEQNKFATYWTEVIVMMYTGLVFCGIIIGQSALFQSLKASEAYECHYADFLAAFILDAIFFRIEYGLVQIISLCIILLASCILYLPKKYFTA